MAAQQLSLLANFASELSIPDYILRDQLSSIADQVIIFIGSMGNKEKFTSFLQSITVPPLDRGFLYCLINACRHNHSTFAIWMLQEHKHLFVQFSKKEIAKELIKYADVSVLDTFTEMFQFTYNDDFWASFSSLVQTSISVEKCDWIIKHGCNVDEMLLQAFTTNSPTCMYYIHEHYKDRLTGVHNSNFLKMAIDDHFSLEATKFALEVLKLPFTNKEHHIANVCYRHRFELFIYFHKAKHINNETAAEIRSVKGYYKKLITGCGPSSQLEKKLIEVFRYGKDSGLVTRWDSRIVLHAIENMRYMIADFMLSSRTTFLLCTSNRNIKCNFFKLVLAITEKMDGVRFIRICSLYSNLRRFFQFLAEIGLSEIHKTLMEDFYQFERSYLEALLGACEGLPKDVVKHNIMAYIIAP